MLEQLGAELGCELAGGKVGSMKIDGMSESPPILVEAWAHQGAPKGAQPNKVMSDAFKLLHARSLFCERPRLILAFADKEAADPFRGTGWKAEALAANDIEVVVVDLPEEIRKRIRRAQEEQKQAMALSVSGADEGGPR